MPPDPVAIPPVALDLALAVLLGAAIGLERQWRWRLAGLRTNTLVSPGATSFVAFADLFQAGEADPTRGGGPDRVRRRLPGRGHHLP